MKIDNKSLSFFESYLLEGSYKSLLQYSKLKTPKKNDWAEHDFIEVDLLEPVLDKRSIILNMVCENIHNLVNYLQLKTYRNYEFTDLGVSYNLRFIGISDVKKRGSKYFFKLKLSNDNPLQDKVQNTVNFNAFNSGYILDNVNLLKYGIVVLEGTRINKEYLSKSKLEIKSKFIDGVNVSEQLTRFKTKTLDLNLFIRGNEADFLKGYRAFLYDLVKPNERVLSVRGVDYKCYYVSSSIKDLDYEKKDVWCEFNIKLQVVD